MRDERDSLASNVEDPFAEEDEPQQEAGPSTTRAPPQEFERLAMEAVRVGDAHGPETFKNSPYAHYLDVQDPLERLRLLMEIHPREAPPETSDILWNTYFSLSPGQRRTELTAQELVMIANLISPHAKRKPLSTINTENDRARFTRRAHEERMWRDTSRFNQIMEDMRIVLSQSPGEQSPHSTASATGGTSLATSPHLNRDMGRGVDGPDALPVDDLDMAFPTDSEVWKDNPMHQGDFVAALFPEMLDTDPPEEAVAARRRAYQEAKRLDANARVYRSRVGKSEADVLRFRLDALLERVKRVSLDDDHKVDWYTRESFAWILLHIISEFEPLAPIVARLSKTQAGVALAQAQLFRPRTDSSALQPLEPRSLKFVLDCVDRVCATLEPRWIGQKRYRYFQRNKSVENMLPAEHKLDRVRRHSPLSGRERYSPFIPLLDLLVTDLLRLGYSLDLQYLTVDRGRAILPMDAVALSATVNLFRRARKIWRGFAAYEIFTNPSYDELSREEIPPEITAPDIEETEISEAASAAKEGDAASQKDEPSEELLLPHMEHLRIHFNERKQRSFRSYYRSPPTPLESLIATPTGKLPKATPFPASAVPHRREIIMQLLRGSADQQDMQGVGLALQLFHEVAAQSHAITIRDVLKTQRAIEKQMKSATSTEDRLKIYAKMYEIEPPVLRTEAMAFRLIHYLVAQVHEVRRRMNTLGKQVVTGSEKKARPLAYEETLMDALRRKMEEWVLLTGREPPIPVISTFGTAWKFFIAAPDPKAITRNVKAEMQRLKIEPPFAVVSDLPYVPEEVRFWPSHHLGNLHLVITAYVQLLRWLNNERATRGKARFYSRRREHATQRIILKGPQMAGPETRRSLLPRMIDSQQMAPQRPPPRGSMSGPVASGAQSHRGSTEGSSGTPTPGGRRRWGA